MYTIYCDGEILHHPMLDDEGKVVIDPVLREAINTHGSLTFRIAPSNPFYDVLAPRKNLVKVVSDSRNAQPWFGRVMQVDMGWNRVKTVYCEGELGCLADVIYYPFGWTNDVTVLLWRLITRYSQASKPNPHYDFQMGNVSVTDPNNTVVRSSAYAYNIWHLMEDKLFGSSLGGYILPRYDAENDIHYIDYLSLDENDQYRHVSSQKIEFGKNLLDLSEHIIATNVATVLVPYGAELEEEDPGYAPDPPSDGHWNGNRLTVASVNDNKEYIVNNAGVNIWGYVWASKVWDDVTVAANLMTKGQKWLGDQIAAGVTLEVSAIDLSLVDADIEQINVGDFVRVVSAKHDLDTLLMCSSKETYLTELERSGIILGRGMDGISDISSREGVFA